jgi:hypothetical protein
MTVLLQPGVAPQQHELAPALAAFGPAPSVIHTLSKVASRPRYEDATRRAAGAASERLRAAR